MGPTILSSKQLELAQVVGIRTNAESNVYAGTGGTTVIVFDEFKDSRWPVLIHIRNLHASEPLYISEDIRGALPNRTPVCSATQFTEILASGTATDNGTGAALEWQKNRPSCVAIFGTNAWRAVVTVRYVDEN